MESRPPVWQGIAADHHVAMTNRSKGTMMAGETNYHSKAVMMVTDRIEIRVAEAHLADETTDNIISEMIRIAWTANGDSMRVNDEEAEVSEGTEDKLTMMIRDRIAGKDRDRREEILIDRIKDECLGQEVDLGKGMITVNPFEAMQIVWRAETWPTEENVHRLLLWQKRKNVNRRHPVNRSSANERVKNQRKPNQNIKKRRNRNQRKRNRKKCHRHRRVVRQIRIPVERPRLVKHVCFYMEKNNKLEMKHFKMIWFCSFHGGRK